MLNFILGCIAMAVALICGGILLFYWPVKDKS